MAVKILVTDLDGTLLDDNSKIPGKNKEALNIIKKKGIRLVVCSGRSYLSLDSYIDELGLKEKDEYAIAFNGGYVYKTLDYEPLCEYLLENGKMKEIIREIEPFNADKFIYDKDSVLLSREDTKGFNWYRLFSNIPARLVDSFDDIDEDVSKIILKGKNTELLKIYEHMLPIIKGRVNMFFSNKSLLEFSHLKANKGEAVNYLARRLGCSREEILAVGDNCNDIPMMEAAGCKVAVFNAVDELKQKADYILKASNNDGALYEIVQNLCDL